MKLILPHRLVARLVALLLPFMASAALPAAEPTPVDFARDIEPLLSARCVACHRPQKAAGGLDLQTPGAALREGDSGSRGIVPGKPEQSEVFRRLVTSDHDDLMPRGGPLSPVEIARIKQWINTGAEWSSRSATPTS